MINVNKSDSEPQVNSINITVGSESRQGSQIDSSKLIANGQARELNPVGHKRKPKVKNMGQKFINMQKKLVRVGGKLIVLYGE